MKNLLKYSLSLGALLSIYFLLMYSAGLGTMTIFRLFNVLIIFGVIFAYLYESKKDESFDYFSGYGKGLQITGIGVFLFALFMGFYTFINVDFLEVIKQSEGLGQYINPFTIMVAVLMEGLGMGLLSTYLSMQFLKENDVRSMDNHYQN